MNNRLWMKRLLAWLLSAALLAGTAAIAEPLPTEDYVSEAAEALVDELYGVDLFDPDIYAGALPDGSGEAAPVLPEAAVPSVEPTEAVEAPGADEAMPEAAPEAAQPEPGAAEASEAPVDGDAQPSSDAGSDEAASAPEAGSEVAGPADAEAVPAPVVTPEDADAKAEDSDATPDADANLLCAN